MGEHASTPVWLVSLDLEARGLGLSAISDFQIGPSSRCHAPGSHGWFEFRQRGNEKVFAACFRDLLHPVRINRRRNAIQRRFPRLL